jgi:tetratricopeptide (TPR) repeat protein
MNKIGIYAGITALVITTAVSHGQVSSAIRQVDGSVLQGKIKWLPASKKYTINDGTTTVEVQPGDVADIRVQQPAALAQAVQQVNAENYSAAVPVLKKIMTDYTMLQWDAVAAAYLAKAYINSNNSKEALSVCKKIIDTNPKAAYSGDMAPYYWQALLDEGRDAILSKHLDDAVAMGDRDAQATALLMRGNMFSKKNEFKDALVDGYLRVVVLYRKQPAARAEAMYKSIDCFTQLGQSSFAEQMRQRLISEYPKSEFAQKAKTGV